MTMHDVIPLNGNNRPPNKTAETTGAAKRAAAQMPAITAAPPLKRISHCSPVGVYQLHLKVRFAGRIKRGGGVKEIRPSLGVPTSDCVKVRITRLQS